jgi:4-amino-4-deoxy-L-arabinose transferase-like glycosyltransferase
MMTRWWIGCWLGCILFAGLAIRLFVTAAAYTSTFDTGTVALMAMDIAQGNEFPLFFYGQNYFGALEAYVAAVFIKLFGMSEFSVACSVILFSLGWIVATYLLIAALFDRRAGLVAATVVSLSGYQIIWYNVASYGGYPVAFFLGTLALWLAVVIRRREPAGGELWMLTAAFGVCVALGLWTHLTVAPFVLAAGLVLLGTVNRNTWKPYGMAGLVAALGLIPGVFYRDVYTGGDTTKFKFTGEHLGEAVDVLVHKNIPEHLFWAVKSGPMEALVPLCHILTQVTLVGMLAWLVYAGVCAIRQRRASVGLLVPTVYAVIFLALYLPHEMAVVKAPRYIIPWFSLMLGTFFAYPVFVFRDRRRWVSVGLLVGFVFAQTMGSVAYGLIKHEGKNRDASEVGYAVSGAQKLGCDYVQMVGGYIYGHRGQKFSFFAGGQPRFVSGFDERHQASAQRAEAAEIPGYVCEEPVVAKLRASFSALGYDAVEESCEVFAPPRNFPAPRLSVSGLEPKALFDRDRSTVLEGTCGTDSLIIDMEKSRQLAGLWMTAPDELQTGLSEQYRISLSPDGEQWSVVAECKSRIAVSYRSGPQAYFKGYFGMQETALSGEGRFLKIEFLRGQGSTAKSWKLNELILFEAAGAAQTAADYSAWLQERGAQFVVADRWLSAHLIEQLGPEIAFPRYNPKFIPSLQSRNLRNRPGLVIAVDPALAEETRALIGPERIASEGPLSSYHFIKCTLPDGLYWNGHFLTR